MAAQNESTSPPPSLLTAPEAARYLRVSQRKLFEMRQRGDVRAVLLGRNCIRYRLSDLDAAVESFIR